MGKPTGFLEHQRLSEAYEPVDKRLKTYKEFVLRLTEGRPDRPAGRADGTAPGLDGLCRSH